MAELRIVKRVPADIGWCVIDGRDADGSPNVFTPLLDVHNQIKRDGKQMDRALDGVDVSLALLGYLGVPIGSAVIGPEVREAVDAGWVAVFVATLTWTLGCTGAVIVLRRSGLISYQLLFAVSLCFFAALAIANWLGRGVLDIEPFANSAPGPFRAFGAFIAAALVTYGWLGDDNRRRHRRRTRPSLVAAPAGELREPLTEFSHCVHPVHHERSASC